MRFSEVGLERIGRMWELALWSASELFCLKHSFQIPFTQTERDPIALSTQRFTERN